MTQTLISLSVVIIRTLFAMGFKDEIIEEETKSADLVLTLLNAFLFTCS